MSQESKMECDDDHLEEVDGPVPMEDDEGSSSSEESSDELSALQLVAREGTADQIAQSILSSPSNPDLAAAVSAFLQAADPEVYLPTQ